MHNIFHLGVGSRIDHGVHHAQVSWLWFRGYDASDADCACSAQSVGQEEEFVEQCALLVQHDLGIEYGECDEVPFEVQKLTCDRCVHYMYLYDERL